MESNVWKMGFIVSCGSHNWICKDYAAVKGGSLAYRPIRLHWVVLKSSPAFYSFIVP